MADDNKTQLGPSVRPGASESPVDSKARTSYVPQAADPLLATTLAGRYVIEKKLGEGGMGAVYLATHNILEKQVALKILHGEFARKPDLVERFMQEAKAASRIRHENVIDISDFGATTEGLVFFAMELLTGHDLHDEVTRARVSGQLLPWERTKKIFLQICAALTAAHAKGIVHRDLKPENIYLVEFLGAPDFVKLLDFGIAKLTDAAEEGGRKLTKTGMLFGTPEYMSPEQARGEQADHRVDIYAMGCILFQLVTNRVPFEAENFMGVLSMHLTEPPPSIPPTVFDQIGAPRALADVIDRALEKDRAKRYQTIDELAAAVRDVCGDPPPIERGAHVQPASVPSPAQTTTRRAATPTSGGAPNASISGERSARVKTQWTGTISVPEETLVTRPARRSKLPLWVGGGVVVAGGLAAVLVLGVGGRTPPAPPVAGSGSAIAGSAGPTVPARPPATAPPAAPAIPPMVQLALDSTPHGAAVTDLTTQKVVGKTPCAVALPGARGTHQFSFHLHGYADAIAEVPLDRESFAYVQPLVKGAATSTPVVHAAAVPPPTPPAPGGAVTRPDQTPATPPATPEVTQPPKPASDDVTPTLKSFGSGSGG